MNTIIEYKDVRQCVYVIYERRGYSSTIDFIKMLTNCDLITLRDRTNLVEFITIVEGKIIDKKRQKRMGQKIRNNLKK